MENLSEKARELRNEYMREWRRKNPDRVRESKARYWERRAKELEEQEGVDKHE